MRGLWTHAAAQAVAVALACAAAADGAAAARDDIAWAFDTAEPGAHTLKLGLYESGSGRRARVAGPVPIRDRAVVLEDVLVVGSQPGQP